MAKKKQPSEMKVKCWNCEVSLRNTPIWAFIIVAIGIMFLLIFMGLSLYNHEKKSEKINEIRDRIVNSVPLSDSDVKMIETLPESEKVEFAKLAIQAEESNDEQ